MGAGDRGNVFLTGLLVALVWVAVLHYEHEGIVRVDVNIVQKPDVDAFSDSTYRVKIGQNDLPNVPGSFVESTANDSQEAVSKLVSDDHLLQESANRGEKQGPQDPFGFIPMDALSYELLSAPARNETETSKAFNKCLSAPDWLVLPEIERERWEKDWALNTLVHLKKGAALAQPRNKVAFQPIPKSGSTALRSIFQSTYAKDKQHIREAGAVLKAIPSSWLSEMQSDWYTRVDNTSIAEEFNKSWYTAVLVTDPFLHLLRGFLQHLRVCTKKLTLVMGKMYNGTALSEVDNANISSFNSALRSLATKRLDIEHFPEKLNIHEVQQTLLLRWIHRRGLRHSFIGKFDETDFLKMIGDIEAKGFRAPAPDALSSSTNKRVGVIFNPKKNNRKGAFNPHFSDFARLLTASTKRFICDRLQEEYRCLGFEFAACGRDGN
jgi:hypothetical protein